MRKTRFHITKKVLLGCIVSFSVLALATSSLAWFIAKNKPNISGEGSINKNYFEGGDGSSTSPFLIKYPLQFYYFSWLQDMGYFNHEDKSNPSHYKQYYFQVIDDLNMSSYNLPPAGSSQYPFIGSFDGGNYSISNLNITNSASSYTDEPENPNHDERNFQIMGVFGVVGQFGTMPYSFNSQINTIKDLNLENITINSITPKNNQTLVGLVAGYVNDNLADSTKPLNNVKVSGNSNIVSNATSPLSFTNHLSDYTLVGYTNNTQSSYVENVDMKMPVLNTSDEGEGTAIIDETNGAGGDLVIAPSGLKDEEGNILYNSFGSNVTSGSRAVDGASDLPDSDMKSAYYFSTVTSRTPSPQPTSFYEYTGSTVDFSGSRTQVDINTRTATSISAASSTDESFQSFLDYIETGHAHTIQQSYVGLRPNNAPVFTGITNFSKYPTNCIWFKPLNTGHCFVSFGVEKMNSSSNMSIYRYKRTSSGAYTGLQELELYFNKTNKLGNGSIALFDIFISDIDYEYCIGKSSNSTDNPAYFFFLKLAGTDAQGGTGIPESVSASTYAVYESVDITTKSVGCLDGVSFISDTTSAFQLNTLNQSYSFTSSENNATVNLSPGMGTHVATPDLTPIGNPQYINTITGFDENNVVNIVLRKISIGANIEWWYKLTQEDDFIETSEAAIGRYFGENAIFTNTDMLIYKHKIASINALVLPETSPTITQIDDLHTLTALAVSTSVNINDVSLLSVNTTTSFTLSFSATGGQLYP